MGQHLTSGEPVDRRLSDPLSYRLRALRRELSGTTRHSKARTKMQTSAFPNQVSHPLVDHLKRKLYEVFKFELPDELTSELIELLLSELRMLFLEAAKRHLAPINEKLIVAAAKAQKDKDSVREVAASKKIIEMQFAIEEINEYAHTDKFLNDIKSRVLDKQLSPVQYPKFDFKNLDFTLLAKLMIDDKIEALSKSKHKIKVHAAIEDIPG